MYLAFQVDINIKMIVHLKQSWKAEIKVVRDSRKKQS